MNLKGIISFGSPKEVPLWGGKENTLWELLLKNNLKAEYLICLPKGYSLWLPKGILAPQATPSKGTPWGILKKIAKNYRKSFVFVGKYIRAKWTAILGRMGPPPQGLGLRPDRQ